MSDTNGTSEDRVEQTANRRDNGQFGDGNTIGNRWQPGQSGCDLGRRLSLVDKLRKRLESTDLDDEPTTDADRITQAAIDKAKDGSCHHWIEMLNRIDGKQGSGEQQGVHITVIFEGA